MSEKIFDVEAEPTIMAEVIVLAKEHGIEASTPMAKDSTSDALDAPLGVDEVRQVMELVTMIATTGGSVVGFLAAVKALLGKSESTEKPEPEIIVIDTRTRKVIKNINAETDLENLEV